MLKAVVFDKDGVLVDTEELIADAINTLVTKHSSIPFDLNDGRNQRGSSAKATFGFLVKKYNLPFTLEEALEKYQEEYEKEIVKKDNLIMDGVIEFLEELKNNNILYGIGTNSIRARTAMSMKGLEKYFDVVVTADDIQNPKPSPDVFLKVAENLGVEPHECVVIGDTNNDSLAARSANMKFIFRDHGLGIAIEPGPDLSINSMREINVEKLRGLFI